MVVFSFPFELKYFFLVKKILRKVDIFEIYGFTLSNIATISLPLVKGKIMFFPKKKTGSKCKVKSLQIQFANKMNQYRCNVTIKDIFE